MKWAMFGSCGLTPSTTESDVFRTLAAFFALEENARAEHGIGLPIKAAVQNKRVETRAIFEEGGDVPRERAVHVRWSHEINGTARGRSANESPHAAQLVVVCSVAREPKASLVDAARVVEVTDRNDDPHDPGKTA